RCRTKPEVIPALRNSLHLKAPLSQTAGLQQKDPYGSGGRHCAPRGQVPNKPDRAAKPLVAVRCDDPRDAMLHSGENNREPLPLIGGFPKQVPRPPEGASYRTVGGIACRRAEKSQIRLV